MNKNKKKSYAIITLFLVLFFIFKVYDNGVDKVLIGSIWNGDTSEVQEVLDKYPFARLDKRRTLSLVDILHNATEGIMTDAVHYKTPSSPLHISLRSSSQEFYGNIDMFGYLLRNGMAPQEGSADWYNILNVVTMRCAPVFLDTLMNYYSDTSLVNIGNTLWENIMYGRYHYKTAEYDDSIRTEVVATLLNSYNVKYINNVDINKNYLYLAMKNGYLDIVKLFVDHGADIDFVMTRRFSYNDTIKTNILRETSPNGYTSEIYEFLISQGADTILADDTHTVE